MTGVIAGLAGHSFKTVRHYVFRHYGGYRIHHNLGIIVVFMG
jgi:hypothetical protein